MLLSVRVVLPTAQLCGVSPTQEGFDEEVEAHRQDRRLDGQRRAMRQRKALFWWLASRRLLTGSTGVCSTGAQASQHRGPWMLDSFHDVLHRRRRRVAMSSTAAKTSQNLGYAFGDFLLHVLQVLPDFSAELRVFWCHCTLMSCVSSQPARAVAPTPQLLTGPYLLTAA